MNTTTNPLREPCKQFFARLNVLYGLLVHLESQLNDFRKSLVQQLEESGVDLSVMAAASALVIRDLTEWPEDNWARYYPTGSFSSRGEEYLKVADILLSRESAWAVSQAYEAFETMLKDITAVYLHNHPEDADEDSLRKKNSTLKKSNLEPSNIEHWRKFTRLTYRSGADVLKYLRNLTPELSEAEKYNNRRLNITAWFNIVSEVRHATTHSDLLVKSARVHSLSEEEDRLLRRFFPGKSTNTGYRLELTRKTAEEALRFFAEYGYLVFKCLSEKQGYALEGLLKRVKSPG